MQVMKPGDRLGENGRFEIEQWIGAGGMGDVFRALDRDTGERVALKIISLDDGAQRTARFAREAELLAQLSHPGIVRHIAHGETAGVGLFLAMEWLEGEDLGQRLERAPLAVGDAIQLALRVAAALGAAHARGIVHRDLKPSNLFLVGGQVDHVKVLDFGIALREGGAQLTKTGLLIGTPGYMAPEQARGGEALIDARADVFALGCVLFLCLTGTPAFDGDSPASILAKILYDEAPRVSERWPEAPASVDALVAQLLAKDPAQRPSDGDALATALALLAPGLGDARAVSAGPRRAPAITGGERRFLSAALIEPVVGSAPLDREGIARAIAPYGGRLELLADGSKVVLIELERQVATDQAIHAVRCALAMRPFVASRPIALAMGRAESTQAQLGGDAVGRAVRALAQLRAAAGAPLLGEVVLDEVIAGLLDARFEVIEHASGALVLRGERALGQADRTLLGRTTACVGRDWELGALAGILDECVEEPEARVAVVTAAAGMGKSRLAAEFLARVARRAEPVAVWVGRGDSLRAGSTLDLLGQALRSALGIAGGEPLAQRQDKLRRRVAARLPAGEHKRVAEFLGELVGAPFSDEGEAGAALRAARQDAQLMSEQMRRAWLDLLRAETAVQPVLLVLEDLQWGDFGTVRFIDTALRERSAAPWMVLALARPDVHEVFPKLWAERQNVQQIRLKELGRKASERLVRQVLGDTVGAETMERLVKLADGNAFYLEELIRAVAEGKADALPETVLAMVETRLGRLPVEARRVLRAASVFGEVCWEGGVAALLGGALGAAQVHEWLSRLVENEVLTARLEGGFAGERELGFRHALLREGAYASLTEDDRQRGHRLAGEWLEQRGEPNPLVLAGHFERGGEGERAAGYYLRAAAQAFHVLDFETTMDCAARGLACASAPELRRALLGVRCEASAHGLHMVKDTMADAEELLRDEPAGSVAWSQAATAYLQGTMLAGRMDDFMSGVGRLHQVPAPAPEAMGRLALGFLAGLSILDVIGQLAAGTALEARFAELRRAAAASDPLAQFWWHITLGLRASYAHEDPWSGLASADAVQPIYDAIGGQHILLNMELFRGMNLWYLGQSAQAEAKLVAIAMADETLGVASSLRRFHLSLLLADRGALAEARALASQLTEHGRVTHNPLEESRGRWALAEVLRREGDLAGAEQQIERAIAMAVPLERPAAQGVQAAIWLAQGRAAEAAVIAEAAVANISQMGGCGMFRGAAVRLIRAEALYADGQIEPARAAIGEARDRLLAIAGRVPDPAYRASFLEAVPENVRTLELARVWCSATP